MRRNVLLAPLLALAMSSACGGKGERSSDADDLSSLEDQSPPAGDQQPGFSEDQPRVSDPLPPAAGGTCEELCGGGGPGCDMSGCLESCLEGPGNYPQCPGEWQRVFVCAVQHGLLCGGGNVGAGLLSQLCGPEYRAFLRCIDIE